MLNIPLRNIHPHSLIVIDQRGVMNFSLRYAALSLSKGAFGQKVEYTSNFTDLHEGDQKMGALMVFFYCRTECKEFKCLSL